MKCREPGLVTPEDVLACATGEADARTAAHVQTCPACAAQAADYAQADTRLKQLFRADCPATQTLGELALDLLDPQDALAVRAHLALCPHCTGELATLQSALRGNPLEDLAPRPSLLERIVARLLSVPDLQGAYAGVRGADNSTTRTYEADGLTISLTIETKRIGAERRWTLLGLVIDEVGDQLPAGGTIRLLRDGRVLAEAALDEVGNLVFDGLEAGTYNLELALAGRVIAIEAIEVM